MSVKNEMLALTANWALTPPDTSSLAEIVNPLPFP